MSESYNYAETTDAAPLLEKMAKHSDAGLFCREEIPVNQTNLFEGEVYCDPCLDKEGAQRMEHDQL